MARSIKEINDEMTSAWISDETIRQKYGLDPTKTFDEQFSSVSRERIEFYIMAMAHHIMERLFDTHTNEINKTLDEKLPHTVRWYRSKVLQFQHPNRALISDTDKYDNTGLSVEQIEELQVVKYCSVEERTPKLLIKVAKGEAGAREVLDPDQVESLNFYIGEIKDAGVPYEIVNQQADKFFCKMEVFYNPMLLTPSEKPVETVIKEYISNLDFNGVYANVWLIDRIQRIPGVVIPHLEWVKTKRASNPLETVEVKTIAESGYFVVENDSDLDITYTPHGQ
jgi:hypothetical protein